MKAMQDEFSRRFKAPAAPEHMAGGEEREKNGKGAGKMKRRQVSVTKALRSVLLWILLGIKMLVEAAEEEISTRQETDCMLEKVPAPRVGNEIRWSKMKTCDRERKEGGYWQKKKKNSQGKVPRTFPWQRCLLSSV